MSPPRPAGAAGGFDAAAAALREPASTARLDDAGWSMLLAHARAGQVLGRIAARLEADGRLDGVAPVMRRHLDGALAKAATQARQTRREAQALVQALAPTDAPVVFLKGAAYLLAGLDPAPGRLFGDIDLLMPEHALQRAEGELMFAGWHPGPVDDYDARYYREWMHELPPMTHLRRGSVVDLHHNILPRVGRLKPSGAMLLEASIDVPGLPGARMLAPADMVLHSMTHLVHNEDLSHGLRDVSDLDLLLRQFAAADAGFWPGLLRRARALDLVPVLDHGLWATHAMLATPHPEALAQEAAALARRRGTPTVRGARALRWAWRRMLKTPALHEGEPGIAAARAIVLAHAHAMRMPPGMLLRHTAHKLALRWRGAAQGQGPAPAA